MSPVVGERVTGAFDGTFDGTGIGFSAAALATAAGDFRTAPGITRSVPTRRDAASARRLTRIISSISIAYLFEISESVSHLTTRWITPEIGGILSTIPGFSISVVLISLAHTIASILTS